jgi:hypothetical protein
MQTTALALQDSILNTLPRNLKEAIETYAVETAMPSAFVIELAIVFFLDPDAMTFDDCKVGVMREPLARLKAYQGTHQGIQGVLEQLPHPIQATIAAYAAEAVLSPEVVIEFALVNFLEPGVTSFDEFQTNLDHRSHAA